MATQQFTGYDSDQLFAQIQAYMISKGYWDAGTWSTDTGQLMLRLLADLIASENYTINRSYEEVFEETARRIDTIAGALHRKGFDFSRLLEDGVYQTVVSDFLYNNTLTDDHSLAFEYAPLLCANPWEYRLTGGMYYEGYITFRKSGMTHTVDVYYAFDAAGHLYCVGKDTMLLQKFVAADFSSTISPTSPVIGGYWTINRMNDGSASITSSSNQHTIYTPVGPLIADTTLLESALMNTVQTFTTGTRNTVVMLDDITQIYSLIQDGTTPVIVRKNRYQSLDLNKAYLSMNNTGKLILKLEEFAIGSGFALTTKKRTYASSAQSYTLHANTEPYLISFVVTRAVMAVSHNTLPADTQVRIEHATKLSEDGVYSLWDMDLTYLSGLLAQPWMATHMVCESTITADLDFFPLKWRGFCSTASSFYGSTEYEFPASAKPTQTAQISAAISRQPAAFTVEYLRNFLKDKLFGNQSLVSINDIKRTLNDIPFVQAYNVFNESGIKITFCPYEATIQTAIDAKLAGSFFTYSYTAPVKAQLFVQGTVYNTAPFTQNAFKSVYYGMKFFFEDAVTRNQIIQKLQNNVKGVLNISGQFGAGFIDLAAPVITFSEQIGKNWDFFNLLFPDQPTWNTTITDTSGSVTTAGYTVVYTFDKPTGILSYTLTFSGDAANCYTQLCKNDGSIELNPDEYLQGTILAVEYVS